MSLNILKISSEVDEGFLICSNCNTEFPIIQKIPIIMEDFVTYIGNRRSLGGRLHHLANTTMMKQFIRNSLSEIKKISIFMQWILNKIYLKFDKVMSFP